MNQLTLILTPRELARRHDPSTSKDAAARTSEFRARHEANIYAAMSHVDGRNIYDIARITLLDRVQVARRMKSMEERKLIKRKQIGITFEGRPIYESRDGCCLWWRA